MNFSPIRIFLASIFLALCIVTSGYIESHDYILRIKMPHHIAQAKGLYGYYKGLEYDLSSKWALLHDEEPITALSVVITDDIEIPQHQGNTITYLMRGDSDCSWYDLTQTAEGSWLIEKRNLEDVPKRLPKQTLIIFINPDLVETIMQPVQTTALDDSEIETITRLPIIAFKKNITSDDFKTARDYALLAAVNLKSVHQPAPQP